ncbi:MAG: hypothetical protein BMS9Abin08_0517 [Gammaproteobacteria bacterium]|nr:MAG: hypothetical protein BMS9Abin08_0517 [Gammaproteobacteria bacterium]
MLHITRQRSDSAWNKQSVVAGILCACLLYTHSIHADITADGTLGTTVNLAGSDFDITGGTGVGSNLFHSFNVFDIHTGETATFQGPASVTRILSRVTGGSTSNIDGTLRSAIGGADLYLINPAGVMFGPNAILDVQGSFHVSTADYLVLGSDGRFDASTPGNSVLVSSAPSAFGFVGNTPASIELNGALLGVPVGETLSVIGGDITLEDATLYAREGRINIASAGSAGEVQVLDDGLSMNGFSRLGDISVRQSTNVSGRHRAGRNILANIDVSGNSGGAIYIRGENFIADNGYTWADTQGDGAGGKIDMVLQNTARLSNESMITAESLPSGSGSGGAITVTAGTISLDSGAVILVNTFGPGDGGSVRLEASDSISISGSSDATDSRLFGNELSKVSGETWSSGQGGRITIDTPRFSLSDRALVTINTKQDGNGGTLNLNVDSLDIRGGAHLVSNSFGSGSGGQINIQATGRVTVSGVVDPSDIDTASSIAANAFADGDGGRIDISARQLAVSDGGLIQSSLTSATAPVTASAGRISVQAQTVELSGGGQIFSGNFSAGQGGGISLVLSERLDISGSTPDGTSQSGVYSVAGASGAGGTVDINVAALNMDRLGTINTSTTADGNAGVIRIQAGSIDLKGGARVSSSTTGAGDGGQVAVSATGAISATGVGSDGFGSGFYSDVQVPDGGQASDASGNGGNIDLTSASMTLSDGATVSAKSNGTGNAGTITVNAGETLMLANNASITTESTISGGGKIVANARDLLYMVDSKITSSVADGSGNGGDITIDPEFVILDSSQIIAQAFAGNGGNISITTNYFIATPDSRVDASSRLGIDGQVNINSPDTDLIGSLTDLPDNFLNAAALLTQRCAARAGGTSSSFVVAGSGGVPASPDGLLYSSVSGFGNQVANSAGTGPVPVMVKAEPGGIPALLMGCGG